MSARKKQENLSLDLVGFFPKHWKEMSMAEVCTLVTDGTHDSPKESESGFPLVTGKAIKNRRIDFNVPYLISKEDHNKVVARSKAERGDILFANIGNSIGDLVRVDTDKEFSIKNVALFKPNPAVIKSRFLEYYLYSNAVQSFIKNSTKGSAQPFIGLASLRGFPVPVPPIQEQDYIECQLGALDDKIETNRQINQTLEQIAQAIFKSWFVDFEPVKAKIAARDALIAEYQTQSAKAPSPQEIAKVEKQAAIAAIAGAGDIIPTEQLQTLADLFPNQLVESELGEIPVGWETSNIECVTANVFSGGTPSTKNESYWGGDLPWFSSGETRNNFVIETEKYITQDGVDGSSTKPSIYGDILIASAGQGHTRGQTSFNAINCYINQSVVALRASECISPYWLYYCLERRYDEMRSISDSHSSRGSLTTKLLKELPIVKADKKVTNSFDAVVKALVKSQIENAKQNKKLESIRDVLLPRLLSGEIDLKTAKAAIDA